MNSWGGATFVLVVETINLSKGVFNTNSLEASSTCPGNNKSKTFWLRLVCMQCLLEWCILRHWSRHVTTSKDKKNSLLENEFAIRKFPCLKSRRAIFNVGQISFLQSRARWLKSGLHSFGPVRLLQNKGQPSWAHTSLTTGRTPLSMLWIPLSRQVRESAGHPNSEGIWSSPGTYKMDLGFSFPTANSI